MYNTCFRLLLCSKLNNAPYLHHVSRAGDSVFILGKHVVINSAFCMPCGYFLAASMFITMVRLMRFLLHHKRTPLCSERDRVRVRQIAVLK